MKNTNISQNKNNNDNTSSVNNITSAPEQSPIIIPANVETPMILRGEVEVVSGSKIFEYTNIEAGEFRLGEYTDEYINVTYFWSVNYVLSPESAEGNLKFSVYCNDELFDSFYHSIQHTDSKPDGGTIGFYIHSRSSTDIFKMTAFTKTENIIFADVTKHNGTVRIPALTMVLDEA